MSRRFQAKTVQNSLRACLIASLAGIACNGYAQEKQPARVNDLQSLADRLNDEKAKDEKAKEIEEKEKVDEAKEKEERDRKEKSEKDRAAERTRVAKEPIAIPPLTVPNLSIEGVGTGKLPEDLVEGRLPPPQSLPFGPDRPYGMSMSLKTWTAPVFCHQPLYFEDAMLERHGHERFPHLTPLISGARFVTGALTHPYMVYLHPPLEDVPNTGHYRPGSPAPGLRERAPYDKGALRFQILTTGAAFVALQP